MPDSNHVTPSRAPPVTPPPDGVAATPAAVRFRLTDLARRTVVAVLVTLLLLGLAAACWRGIYVLLEAFAGVLFAVFLNALADWLSKHSRLSYGWALTVVVIALTVIVVGAGWLIGNRLALQVQSLLQRLPESLEHVRKYLERHAWGRTLLDHLPRAAQSLTESGQMFQISNVFTGLVSVFEFVIVVLVVGIFGAAEPGVYRAGVLHLVPPRHRERAGEAVDTVVFNLRWWLVGQICLMIIIGITTGFGLWLIGVPLALTLGVLAGMLEIIPYLGAWMAAVPAALMAVLISPAHLIGVLALYLFLHILEGYVLLPLIQKRAVHLPPALTVVMQVLLAELLGFMGLFVAAPLTVLLVVLLKMLYVEDTLGDSAVDVPGEPGHEPEAAARDGPTSR
jgi:predicted PurR-regulated permease PerM